MKYKIEIIDPWPEVAKLRGGFDYVNYSDKSLTPLERRVFVLDDGEVYEHRILAPVLSDIPDDSLLRVENLDRRNYIVEVFNKWPTNINSQNGFIPKSKFNRLEFGYLAFLDEFSVIPSHLEFNTLIPYYKEHLDKNKARPLIKISKMVC